MEKNKITFDQEAEPQKDSQEFAEKTPCRDSISEENKKPLLFCKERQCYVDQAEIDYCESTGTCDQTLNKFLKAHMQGERIGELHPLSKISEIARYGDVIELVPPEGKQLSRELPRMSLIVSSRPEKMEENVTYPLIGKRIDNYRRVDWAALFKRFHSEGLKFRIKMEAMGEQPSLVTLFLMFFDGWQSQITLTNTKREKLKKATTKELVESGMIDELPYSSGITRGFRAGVDSLCREIDSANNLGAK